MFLHDPPCSFAARSRVSSLGTTSPVENVRILRSSLCSFALVILGRRNLVFQLVLRPESLTLIGSDLPGNGVCVSRLGLSFLASWLPFLSVHQCARSQAPLAIDSLYHSSKLLHLVTADSLFHLPWLQSPTEHSVFSTFASSALAEALLHSCKYRRRITFVN